MINSVDSVNFKGCKRGIKSLLPRKLVGYSTHTPKEIERPYGYYMPESYKQNPVKKFLNKIIENYKEIKESIKPE